MGLLNRGKNKDLDEFARSLAAELTKRFTPEMEAKSKDKKAEKKLGLALNGIYAQARTYREENRLGIYGKARIGNTFKWELRERGYSDPFIEETTKGLVLKLSGK